MSNYVDFYCWCGMCAYTARVKPSDISKFGEQEDCPDCASIGELSFLEGGKWIPDFIAPSDPIPTWSPAE